VSTFIREPRSILNWSSIFETKKERYCKTYSPGSNRSKITVIVHRLWFTLSIPLQDRRMTALWVPQIDLDLYINMNEFNLVCISRDLRVRNNGIETVRFWIRDVVTMCDVSDRSSVSYSSVVSYSRTRLI
jgi:hypothetical protein